MLTGSCHRVERFGNRPCRSYLPTRYEGADMRMMDRRQGLLLARRSVTAGARVGGRAVARKDVGLPTTAGGTLAAVEQEARRLAFYSADG